MENSWEDFLIEFQKKNLQVILDRILEIISKEIPKGSLEDCRKNPEINTGGSCWRNFGKMPKKIPRKKNEEKGGEGNLRWNSCRNSWSYLDGTALLNKFRMKFL